MGSTTASAGARVSKAAATGQGPGFSALSSRVDYALVWRVELRIWAAGAPRFAGSPDFPLRRTPTLRSGPLGNYRWPKFGSATEAAVESFSAAARKRDLRPGVAPRRAQNGNFVLCRAGPAVASRPAPRTLPLLWPADWKRPRRRPGWERGPAAPGGLRVELGCKLSGRREGGGPGRSSAAPALGASRWALPVFLFSLVDGDASHKSPRAGCLRAFPASLQLELLCSSGRPYFCCFSSHEEPHFSKQPKSTRVSNTSLFRGL